MNKLEALQVAIDSLKYNHSKVGMMLMTKYDLDAMLEATEQALKEKNT